MASRAIARDATTEIAAIKERVVSCRVYSRSNAFRGADCSPSYAWADHARFGCARLSEHTERDHHWVVDVHLDLWYELRAEPPA